ncbi:cell wall-binding repeat-containing protein [Mobiluncus mulieris]|nr:cell wall-binding repeat-containing protein [Mobiluncus mulieris]
MMNFGKKMAVGVASAALVASLAGVPAAVAVEEPRPLDGGWDRIASDRANNDRIDTALEVAKVAFPEVAKAKAVYVANSTAMIDAATAGQLTDGPILLVDNNSRTLDVVKAQVAKYTSATTVYAVGGEQVVPEATLKAVAGDKKTGRLGGKSRYETAMSVAKRVIEVEPSKSKNVIVSRADVPIDALAAGTLDHGPVFYTKDGELPEDVKTWVKDHKVQSVIGLGGKNAVPDKALSEALDPVVKVNPGKADLESINARKAFEEARAKYLGVNTFRSDFEITKAGDPNYLNTATSRDPRMLDLGRQDAGNRFEGYKALAREVAGRMDVVDSAVKSVKMDIANKIKDAKGDYSMIATGIASDLGKLYGTANQANIANNKDFFVFDEDGKVTGVAYGAIESNNEAVKTAIKSDKARIKAYFEHKDAALLGNVVAPTGYKFDSVGVESQNLFSNKSISTLTTGGSNLVVLQRDTELFLAQAKQNADSTSASMLDAWAKLKRGTGYVRLGGADRYSTAAMISQYLRLQRGAFIDRVYLANGESMVDALVAGVFTRGPILLVNKAGTLTDATKTEMQNIGQFLTVSGDKVVERKKGAFPAVLAVGGKNSVTDAAAAAAAAEVKVGNDRVTEKEQKFLVSKELKVTYAEGAKAVANSKPATLSFSFQVPTGKNADKATVTWQYRADANGSWSSVADSTPAGVTYGTETKTPSDKGIVTVSRNITTPATDAGKAGDYRALVTYKNDSGVTEKEIATNPVTVQLSAPAAAPAQTLTAVTITMNPVSGEVKTTASDTGAKTVTLTCDKTGTAVDVQYSWEITGASGQVKSGAADATHFGAGALNTKTLTLTSPAHGVATSSITIPADKIVCKATSVNAGVNAGSAKTAKNTVIKYTKG